MCEKGFKLCHKCGDEWMESDEFFPRNMRGTLVSPCWACWHEQRHETNRTKPCCYPGCTKPRENEEKTRCYEHRYYALGEAKNHVQRPKR